MILDSEEPLSNLAKWFFDFTGVLHKAHGNILTLNHGIIAILLRASPADQGFVFSVTLKDPLPIKVDGRSRKKGKDFKGLIQLLKQGIYHHLKDNHDCQDYVSIWGSDGKAQLKQTLRVSDWEDQRTEEHRITPSEVPESHLQYPIGF